MKVSVIIATVVVAAALPTYSTAAPINARVNDSTGCTNVAVQGDATFCIAGPVCSGSGETPSGKNCPQAKAVAVSACAEGAKSYDSKLKTCIAPVGSSCVKLTTGGAWGCTWDIPAAPTVTPSTTSPLPPTTKAPAPTTTAPAPVTLPPITTGPVPIIKTPSPTTSAPAPTTKAPPAPPAPGCTTVSVEGDAIFCIKGPVCSGWDATPVGTLCPNVGDAAIDECFDDMKSYNKKSNTCVAPVVSSCKKVTSGAWGCVWDLPSSPAPALTTKAPVTPGPTTKAPMTPGPTTKIPVTSAPGVMKPPTVPGCTTMSVEGDAIFCIKGPVCSGWGAAPSGTVCPKVGDWAVDECFDDMKSYNKKDDYCVAPVTSSCKKVTSGAWGCVWDLPAPAVTPASTTKAPAVTPATTTKAPAVTPAATVPAKGPTFPVDCIDVSVEGDATFCITGPICSGSGVSPAGTNCPKVGDYAIDDCYDYLKSGKSNSTYCVAPVDASCKKIKTGVWGCVWNVPETTVSTKTSLAVDGVAGASANSIGAIAGCVAAALAVAGAAFAAVVHQRKKRQEQEQQQNVVEGQFIGMTQSPAVFRG